MVAGKAGGTSDAQRMPSTNNSGTSNLRGESPNSVQLLLSDLRHADPAAAHHIVSLLPPGSRKALSGSCKAGHQLAQQTYLSLILSPVISNLPKAELAARYPQVTTLIIPPAEGSTQAQHDALNHLCNTCPVLLSRVQTLMLHYDYFLSNRHSSSPGPAWHFDAPWRRLIHCCSSLKSILLVPYPSRCVPWLSMELPDHMSCAQRQQAWQAILPLQSQEWGPPQAQVQAQAQPNAQAQVAPAQALLHEDMPAPATQVFPLDFLPYIRTLFVCPGSELQNKRDPKPDCAAIVGAVGLRELDFCVDEIEEVVGQGLLEAMLSSPLTQLTKLRLEDSMGTLSAPAKVARMLALHSQLRELDITGALGYFPESLRLPCLSKLTFEMCNDEPANWDGFANFTSLKVLKVSRVGIDLKPDCPGLRLLAALQKLPNLENLDLRFWMLKDAREEGARMEGFSQVLPPGSLDLPALEVLKTKTAFQDFVGTHGLLKALAAPKLRRLESVLPLSRFVDVAASFPSLDIQQSGDRLVVVANAEELVSVAESAPQLLQYLGLHMDEGHRSGIIKLVNSVGGELLHLNLLGRYAHYMQDSGDSDALQGLGDSTLGDVASVCVNLRTLGLRAADGELFTAKGLGDVARGLPKLERLKLRGCVGVDDECFTALVRGCPELRHIEMDGMEGVTEQGLLYLAEHNDAGVGKRLVIRCRRGLTAREIQHLQQAGWDVEVDPEWW